MIDDIINVTQDMLSSEPSELLQLSLDKNPRDKGMLDFRRDMAKALVESAECKELVSKLINAELETDIDSFFEEPCLEQCTSVSALFLVGQAVRYKIKREKPEQ